MRINAKALAVVILVTLFAGIAASSALGFWSTEGGGGGQGAGSPAESGEAGDGLIRGRTTFQELLDLGLPQDRIERVLGGEIPQAGMRVKDYCTQVGLDFETIKEQLQIELDQLDR